MNPTFMRALQNLRQDRQRKFNWDQWKGVRPTNEGWASTPWEGNSPQVIVYDPRTGKAFPSPQVAISAGVSNFVKQIPPGMTIDWSYWDRFKQPEAAKVKSAPMAKIEDQSVQSGPNNGLLADAEPKAEPEAEPEVEDKVVDTPHVYDPKSMKGTKAEVKNKFKTGTARQDAKTWRAAHMKAATDKYGKPGDKDFNKSEYLKKRNKIANRHRIMIGAGEKTTKEGVVLGKDPTIKSRTINN